MCELEELEVLVEDILFDIYFEDKDMFVVNKFEGMVVYLFVGYVSGMFVNVLLFYCDDLLGINGKICLGIVYWIDKDIFGLLMVVKNDYVYELLVK